MSGERKRPIYIDCDPGLDDAVAIALAACAPELEIAALSVVAGNAALERTLDNALSVTAALGLKVPVHAGADRPLRVKPQLGTEIWGGNGSLNPKRPRRSASPESAADALVRIMKNAPDHSLLLCCLGPLTNLATVLQREPALSAKIDRLLLMGGARGNGNVTTAAEFNIWFDPQAAKRVFDADLNTVVVPYDLTRTVMIGAPHIQMLSQSNAPEAQLSARMAHATISLCLVASRTLSGARSLRDVSYVPSPQQTPKLILHDLITLTYARFQAMAVHNRDMALGIANHPHRLQAPGDERDTLAADR